MNRRRCSSSISVTGVTTMRSGASSAAHPRRRSRSVVPNSPAAVLSAACSARRESQRKPLAAARQQLSRRSRRRRQRAERHRAFDGRLDFIGVSVYPLSSTIESATSSRRRARLSGVAMRVDRARVLRACAGLERLRRCLARRGRAFVWSPEPASALAAALPSSPCRCCARAGLSFGRRAPEFSLSSRLLRASRLQLWPPPSRVLLVVALLPRGLPRFLRQGQRRGLLQLALRQGIREPPRAAELRRQRARRVAAARVGGASGRELVPTERRERFRASLERLARRVDVLRDREPAASERDERIVRLRDTQLSSVRGGPRS